MNRMKIYFKLFVYEITSVAKKELNKEKERIWRIILVQTETAALLSRETIFRPFHRSY